MNPNILTVIRMVLSAFGAYLLGKNLFGHAIDESLWQEIVGGAMIVISLVMTVLNKTSTYEAVEGFIRQTVTALGGLLVGLGIVKDQAYTTVSSIVIALLPYILSLLGKKKSQEIATGNLGVADLTGVKEIATKGEKLKPVINTPEK